MTPDPVIGSRLFADGSTRPVYRDAEGRYVLDDAGGVVRGRWLLAEEDRPGFSDWCDVPLVVAEREG